MEFFNPQEELDQTIHRLPHWRQGSVPVFVTFRLADSLPAQLLRDWFNRREMFLRANPGPWDEATEACYHALFSEELDRHLDAAHGSCALRDPRIARIVADRLRHFNGTRYDLLSYVIMPNHVHLLFTVRDGESLADILKSWKGVSSRLIHKNQLSDMKPFWQPDYYDRLVRGVDHFNAIMDYIRDNPAKARLSTGFVLWQRS
jgi:REP element-mobilizing transposase RayT